MKLKKEFEELAAASLGEGVAAKLFSALSSSQVASSAIRINPEKFAFLSSFLGEGSMEDALELPSLSPITWCEGGYYVNSKTNFTLSPLFQCGAYYVQDSSSMFLELLRKHLKSKVEELHRSNVKQLVVLDLCAAPGGKSTHLISLVNQICKEVGTLEPLVVCNEAVAKRVGALQENIAKWGYDNVLVTSNYPSEFKRLKEKRFSGFDIILTDVPCSGEGMFRKSDSALEDWSIANVNKCARLQKEILSDIWPLLKAGGLLIYSTCTYNHLENADNVRFILEDLGAENLNASIKELSEKAGAVPISKEPLGFQFVPGLINGEGQFFSLLKKRGDGASFKALNHKEIIHKSLKIVSSDSIVQVKGKDVIPEPEFALSIKILKELSAYRQGKERGLVFSALDVSKEMALKYLRKETMTPSEIAQGSEPLPLGYILLTYKQLPLGFIKNLGNRINNLLPNNRRILSRI